MKQYLGKHKEKKPNKSYSHSKHGKSMSNSNKDRSLLKGLKCTDIG
jgi:hypothetical protein